ncbi:MAG: hypothetical protein GXP62_11645, partial [Oligoflexia bacterium]|nr:hypothetical protein [Oligoflexia bacterium]
AAASYSGAVYVQLGPITADMSLSATTAVLEGTRANEFAGFEIDFVGDYDGDGYDDLAIGNKAADLEGSAWLVLGPVTGTMSLSASDGSWTGEGTASGAGYAVRGVGDIDGDGLPDLGIGSWGYNSYYGAAYVISGGTTGSGSLSSAGLRIYAQGGENLGQSISPGGDLDADGCDDLLVGSPYRYDPTSGSVFVYSSFLVFNCPGSGAMFETSADAEVYGAYGVEQYSDYPGGLVGGGDANGDGYDDVLLGSESGKADPYTRTGSVWVIEGPITADSDLFLAAARFDGDADGDYFGQSVGWGGDIDGDGTDDVIVGAPCVDRYGLCSGAAYLYYSPASGTISASSMDAVFYGDATADHAGAGVAGAGDLDGDGYQDLLVGAWAATGDATKSGVTYILPAVGL